MEVPLFVSVVEAARLLGRGRKSGGGRTGIYNMISAGELDAVKIGTRTLITRESIERRARSLTRIKPSAAT